jgi:hypothetical protein
MVEYTFTLSNENLYQVEELVNQAVEQGRTVTVNGSVAQYRWGKPASSWGTGSLSVKTPARTTRGTREDWYKLGAKLTVVVS